MGDQQNFHSKHDGNSKYGAPSKQEQGKDYGVNSKVQVPLDDTTLFPLTPINGAAATLFKLPVVLAESTLQINVEADVSLYPPATEIKRVKKHAFLDQVKLVPVDFTPIATTGYFQVTRAKLFVSGHIRKNIEYASADHNAPLQDRIANVKFSGFAELTEDDFASLPIIGISDNAEANFLNEKTEMDARLDKYFFQNAVKYNEQPYGELIAANFYELDYSPHSSYPDGSFSTLREKIVLDLSLKVLQVQQFQITAEGFVPNIPGGLTT